MGNQLMDQLRLMSDNQLIGESAEAREEDQLTRESAEETELGYWREDRILSQPGSSDSRRAEDLS